MRFAVYIAAMAVLATPALAQSSTTSTGSAQAEAIAIAPGAGDPSGDPSGDSHLTETIHNTPDVAIDTYAGGTNPCGIGGSLGMSVAGFGIGGGVATTSHECVMRAWFVLLAATAEHTHNAAYMQWAQGIACQQKSVREAAPAGMCATATPPAAAPVAQMVQPQRVAVTAPVAQPVKRVVPAWCAKAAPTTVAGRDYVEKVCG